MKGATMREILFKAKRIDNGEWVEGYLVYMGDVTIIICAIELDCSDGENTDLYATEWYKVDPSTLCQYTGLMDKIGQKIWENDILMRNGNKDDLVKAVYGEFGVIAVETEEVVDNVIGWHYEVIETDAISRCEPFCLPMPLTEEYISECEMEVVGNIFDNPELLEGSEA